MATTGELPPSARAGQAFIHDPKVADVTEVKAQIKLRFRDVRRQPCVVTRSFQLAQKSGGKLEKKDLDQVIQTLDEKTGCLLYTSPSPRDRQKARMPSSA